MKKPVIGMIVLMNLTAKQAREIGGNAASNVSGTEESPMLKEPQTGVGIIVQVWGESENPECNLKVHGDGNTCIWVTSAHQGTNEGEFTIQ